jgi:hypothetical protein
LKSAGKNTPSEKEAKAAPKNAPLVHLITRLKTSHALPYLPSTQAMDGFYGTFYKRNGATAKLFKIVFESFRDSPPIRFTKF